MSKVAVATSVHRGRESMIPLLIDQLNKLGVKDIIVVTDGTSTEGLPGQIITVDQSKLESITERAGAVRAAARDAFFQEKYKSCTDLFFHDSDMEQPDNVIALLNERKKDVISALYCVRYGEGCLLPLYTKDGDSMAAVSVYSTSVVKTNKPVIQVDGFGLGAMLISRKVLEDVPFRDSKFYKQQTSGEDYQWCVDAADKGYKIFVDTTLVAKHHDDTGSYAPSIGDLVPAVTYVGSSARGTNTYGVFDKGIPQYHHSEEVAAILKDSPEFEVANIRKVELAYNPAAVPQEQVGAIRAS